MRADEYLFKIKLYDSRTKAKQAIERGEVYIDNINITKSSMHIDELVDHDIKKVCDEEYVSLGGYKLKKGLIDFNFSVNNLTCADIGASTGGFTDCLLKYGAKKVYAVDLNDSLLHYKLKQNERVIPIIKNAKQLSLNDFNDKIDLITVDLSFISASLILPILSDIIDDNKNIILLIKPQFETQKKEKHKNGIIKDKVLRYNACKNVIECAEKNNLYASNITTAPIYEDKNIEYLVFLTKGKKSNFNLKEYFC